MQFNNKNNEIFPAVYNDQFETPLDAYEDIYILLEYYRRKTNKNKEDFIIYDPYYCEGLFKIQITIALL